MRGNENMAVINESDLRKMTAKADTITITQNDLNCIKEQVYGKYD